MTHTAKYHPALPRQQGVTLLTGLVLLAAISLLALVAASSMVLQLRMAGNFEDSRLALQNSAMAVALGEDFLYSVGQDGRIPDCQGTCFNSPLSTIIHQTTELPAFPEYEAESWWRSWGAVAGVAPLSGVSLENSGVPGAEPPRFLIEEVHFDPTTGVPVSADAPLLDGIGYYRILGRGSGRGAAAIAVSESIVARPWKADALPGPGNGDVHAFCADYRPWYDCGRMAWRQRR
jgi:Tfp pilus assembly protein PilX